MKEETCLAESSSSLILDPPASFGSFDKNSVSCIMAIRMFLGTEPSLVSEASTNSERALTAAQTAGDDRSLPEFLFFSTALAAAKTALSCSSLSALILATS